MCNDNGAVIFKMLSEIFRLARKFENVGKGEIKYILLRFYLISILTSNALTLSLGCCEKLTTILKVNCIFYHDHYLFDKTQRVPLRCYNRDN